MPSYLTYNSDLFPSSSMSEYARVLHSSFTGKEKDTETGYHYFGARYYSSDFSIWLSVDPMADKYPSLSPYNYCAWNPLKIVDTDGNKIWIVGNNGYTYQYQNGKIFTDKGCVYKGNDIYVTKVSSDLSELKSLGIRKEIRKMERSDLDIVIRYDIDNTQCSLDDIGEKNPKIGSGTNITYKVLHKIA